MSPIEEIASNIIQFITCKEVAENLGYSLTCRSSSTPFRLERKGSRVEVFDSLNSLKVYLDGMQRMLNDIKKQQEWHNGGGTFSE